MDRSKWLISWLAAIVLAVVRPCAAGDPSREYVVKAAFIYNFTQFVTWPKTAFDGDSAPFVIGVVGDDPFDGALEQAMQDKTVDCRPIVVKHFASVDQVTPCQALFVPANQDDSLPGLFARLGKSPVLTIGESDAFLPGGGAIRFFLDDNKIRFEINPMATDAAGLKVSAKLMKLARIYKG